MPSGDPNVPDTVIDGTAALSQIGHWSLVFPGDGPPGPGFPGEGPPNGRVYVRALVVHDGTRPFYLIPVDRIRALDTLLTQAQRLSIKAAEVLEEWDPVKPVEEVFGPQGLARK